MKSKSRRVYLDAMIERIVAICSDKVSPVVVDAYRLFDEACESANQHHTYNPSNAKNIVALFGGSIEEECKSLGIHIFKVPGALVSVVGHGCEAEINESLTAPTVAACCVARAGHPHEGFACFGSEVSDSHPIVIAALNWEAKPTITRMQRLRERADDCIESGILNGEDFGSLKDFAPPDQKLIEDNSSQLFDYEDEDENSGETDDA